MTLFAFTFIVSLAEQSLPWSWSLAYVSLDVMGLILLRHRLEIDFVKIMNSI